MNIKIVSWNVRSLQKASNQANILNYLSQFLSFSSIILIQEHHLKPTAIEDLTSRTTFLIHSTPHLLTLISPSLNSHLQQPASSSSSLEDRLLTTYLKLNDGTSLEVGNLYAPVKPEQREPFFSRFRFPHRPHYISLLAGDFNDCPNVSVDRKNQSNPITHWPVLKKNFPVQMTDTVRKRHPSRTLFTRPQVERKGGRVRSWSRIDHILLSTQHKSTLRDAHIRFDAPGSDHRPVVAIITVEQAVSTAHLPSTNALTRRISPLLFRNGSFADEFRHFYETSITPQTAHLPSNVGWEVKKQLIVEFAQRSARQLAQHQNSRRLALETTLISLENETSLTSSQQIAWTDTQLKLHQLNTRKTETLCLRTGTPYYPNSTNASHVLRQRLAVRKASTTFTSIKLEDGTETADLEPALEATRRHFQEQFTPSTQNKEQVETARNDFLDFIRTTSPDSDPRFARRWSQEDTNKLDAPFTISEVKRAILDTPNSSSPGLSGLPYEFYKQNLGTVVSDLTASLNASWSVGYLQPSQTEARVRLLFKYQKPNADPKLLSHYRPISLRETDYRILSRLVVARLNPLLSTSIPRNQIGFVPGRESSEAAFQLQLVAEEVAELDLPGAAVIGLDQAKAYDLDHHEWILACYAAFGASSRFLRLLSAIYDSNRLTARYNINGYFSDPISLRCGLPQGCPLSCASWLISFQPFLDALVRRKIALTLLSPLHQDRPSLITSLAFADDSTLLVESISSALPKLRQLSHDWRLATNGRLNPEKTTALAIGKQAQQDPLANEIVWSQPEELVLWAGFPISTTPQPAAHYELLLMKVERKCKGARGLYSSARTRTLYANSHIVSLVLHTLSFYPAPLSFLQRLKSLLVDFVWGGHWHAVSKEIVFRPVSEGGLGLLSPTDFDTSHNLRRLNTYMASIDTLYYNLFVRSFLRHVVSANSSSHAALLPLSPLSFFRTSSFCLEHPLWQSLARSAKSGNIAFVLSALTLPQILSIPPSYFCSHPSLSSISSIAELYFNGARSPLYTLPDHKVAVPLDKKDGKSAKQAWQFFTRTHNILSRYFPTPRRATTLPFPSFPEPRSFTLLGLNHGFSASEGRLELLRQRSSSPVLRSYSSTLHTDEDEWRRTWLWINARPVSPREAETHWRLLHSVVITRTTLHRWNKSTPPTCVFCCDSPDTISHAFFSCAYSKEYWSRLLETLSNTLSTAFNTSTFSPDEILMGLPTLRSQVDASVQITIRAVVAVAIQTLADVRWSRIKPDPSQSSPSPSELSQRTINGIVRRLS